MAVQQRNETIEKFESDYRLRVDLILKIGISAHDETTKHHYVANRFSSRKEDKFTVWKKEKKRVHDEPIKPKIVILKNTKEAGIQHWKPSKSEQKEAQSDSEKQSKSESAQSEALIKKELIQSRAVSLP